MADTNNGCEASDTIIDESKTEIDTKMDEPESKSNTNVTSVNDKVTKDVDARIIRQIEYYFGDANLARDKFLSEEILKDNGWVTLELLLTFKRMQSLTSDAEVVCKALEKSESGLIEISEDRLKVRRHPDRPLPESNEETRKECITRTAYVKGFPLDMEMAELIEFFDTYEKVVNIVMRKYMDKPTKTYQFKGSVFVTFLNQEQCEKFVQKESVEFKGVELIRKLQEDYYTSKKSERSVGKQKKNDEKLPKITFPKGAVLFFEGCSDKVTRELIKNAVTELDGDVAYIDYAKGDKNGYIRLTEENAAKQLIEKLEEAKLKLSDSEEVTLRLLEDNEETEYLEKQVKQMLSKRSNSRGGRGGNRFGGNRFNRKRHRSPSEVSDEPAAKKA